MKHYIQAIRFRTLPLSVSGVVLGSFIARWRLLGMKKEWDWRIFILAILVTMLYQILSNFANDYGDSVKGTDRFRSKRAEERVVASGKISADSMRKMVYVMAGVSFLATILLLWISFYPNFEQEFWVFIGLGIACILAAIGYTMGKKPYGYIGLGDMMVFIFFGQVSVAGSYFLFTKSWSWDILLPASAVGLMSVAVLNLNNMRDIESDKLAGKKSLASRLGFRFAMIYQIVLMQLPLILILIFLMLNHLHTQGNYYAFIVMILFFPMTSLRRRIMQTKDPEYLDPFLKQVAIMTFVMVLLLSIGLNL